MIIKKVDFTGGGDGIKALYIDDKLYKYGDYYHDKIDQVIEGFLEGLTYAKVKYTLKEVKLPETNEWVEKTSDAEPPPEEFMRIYPERTYKIPTTRKKIKKKL